MRRLLCTVVLIGVAAVAPRTAAQSTPDPRPAAFPPNQWVLRKTPAFPGGIGAPSKHVRLTYDTTRHVIYFWGGDYCVSDPMFPDRCDSHEELFSYDVAADRWQPVVNQTQAVAAGFPRGRCLPGMAYDPVHDVLWMTSGSERFDQYAPGLRPGGIWSFDLTTKRWTRQGPSPDGESKKVRAINTNVEDLVYDPVSKSLFTFTRDDPNSNDVAFFFSLKDINLADGRSKDNWSAHGLATLNDETMGAYSFAVDTKRNRAIVYLPKFGETWAFDFSTRKMRRLVKQTLPAKSVFGMVYDSGNDAVVFFAGYNNYEGEPHVQPLNDLWVLDLTKNSWSKPALTGKIPSPRKGESLVYDSANQVLVQMGGTGGWQDGPDSFGYHGTEVFLLRLQLGGSPPPPPSPHTAAPKVSVTTPQSGATLSGVTPLQASAADNGGVAGVQFKVDGANVGAEVAASPYSFNWDSRTVANGRHAVSAAARDATGNLRTSVPVSVTVSNVAPPLPPGPAGWTRHAGQTIKRVCPPDPSPPSEGCSAVVADWSGGIADTRRNRLIIWGGGHTGYYGNELYAFNLTSNTLVRLNNTSP